MHRTQVGSIAQSLQEVEDMYFFYLAEKQKSNTKECYTLGQVCQT